MLIYLHSNFWFLMMLIALDLTELVRLSLERRRFRRALINVYKHLKRGCKKGAARPFSVVASNNRQWTQDEIWEFPSENERTLAQVGQRGHRASLLRGTFSFKILLDTVLGKWL